MNLDALIAQTNREDDEVLPRLVGKHMSDLTSQRYNVAERLIRRRKLWCNDLGRLQKEKRGSK